jgi:transposase
LLWGDILGYVWGSSKERVKIAIDNDRERQTYYGALNLYSQEFIIKDYQTANGTNTVKFIKELIAKHHEQKLLLIWDGASYHRGQEMQDFLKEINHNNSANDWKITCCLFAPYAPEENPVEAIWLQVKTFLRRFYHLAKKFKVVKRLFQFFFDLHLFNFPNLKKYDAFSQLK